ncbi:unnamed protein product, partial [Ranitomeya imitator]
DPHTLVQLTSFLALNKFQPFHVSISSNTLLLLDFHSHLIRSEVVGYLGGRWDTSSQCKYLSSFVLHPIITDQLRGSPLLGKPNLIRTPYKVKKVYIQFQQRRHSRDVGDKTFLCQLLAAANELFLVSVPLRCFVRTNVHPDKILMNCH